jgi:trk system potassium uptake protein TrkH
MIDLRPVLYVVGLLLAAVAAAMLLPLAVDAVDGNPDWQVFAVAAALTGFVGVSITLTCHSGRPFDMDIRQAFLLTTLAWVAMACFAALPFMFIARGLDYADAFFEAISGLTTTGSTVLEKLESLPRGVLLWRSLLQWIGGVGIVVMAIIILPFLRVGGMQLFRTESSDRSEKVAPRPGEFVGYIAITYLVISSLCALAYWLAGMSGFDAVNHAMTTIATGGYSTHDASMGHFREPSIHWIGTLFMLAGALPFTTYIRTVQGRDMPIWRDSQVRAYVFILAGVIVATGLWIWRAFQMPFEAAMRHAAFNIVSVATTTGYATTDYQLWGAPVVGLFFILLFVGGCTGSTAGGIKMFRFQILWSMTRIYLALLLRPHRIVVLRYQGRRVPDDVPYSVLAFLVAYAGTVGVLTLGLTASGLDLVTALTGAAQAVSNVGPGLGAVIGPAGNFASLSDTAKWLLSFGMLLGRLELFTVLVLLQRSFWRW